MTHLRAVNSLFDFMGDAAQEIGDRTVGPGLNYRAGFIAATFLIGPGEERVIAGTVEKAGAQVLKNRAAGNAFRDELAGLLRSEGRDVATEVYKRTLFGKRFIDIEVSMNGRVLGGIEAKVGGSPYTPLQRIKDRWLYTAEDYIVNVARKP